ncbi:MAG: glycoside hydrolase N-terminal domain-containing protein [Clostridia bacterium]|nr:glycoside hydrolase N-terminal domain-containing protein [Clostridia bacterium]
MSRNDTLLMSHPASWDKDMGKDSTPLGNGKTGALLQGGAAKEEIIINRSDCWWYYHKKELPDVSESLQKMRELIDKGEWAAANRYMYDRLCDNKYFCEAGMPFLLGSLKIKFVANDLFTDYSRKLFMDKAECEITYNQGSKNNLRRCFISRRDDTLYYEFRSNEKTQISIDFGMYDDFTEDTRLARERLDGKVSENKYDNGIDYAVKNDETEYSVSIRIFGAQSKLENGVITMDTDYFRLALKCNSGKGSKKRIKVPCDFDYNEKLASHISLHKRLYNSCDIKLCRGKNLTNEALLEESFRKKASPELIEKMWRFGRYLFICASDKNGLPFPLYGLWHYRYAPMWAQHVANENVEIIYWHLNAGGLAELTLPLINYYFDGMEAFRNNAKKLYGCNGIFIGGYSSPANKQISVFVPVILNFTGVAGWLSEHFYKYYLMTRDRKTLDQKIFPFMLAAADFYLDYVTYDKNGQVVYYPCVSPENSPKNLIEVTMGDFGHPNPVTKNSVMELAIVKELFTNLISLINETGEHTQYIEKLQYVLDRMPPYLINEEGALKEWATPELEDNYAHRHISHIYPLFPAEEISKENDPELYAALERAVDLRVLGSQSAWSLAHTASIYATLGRGEHVMKMLDTMLKASTVNNFFTLHNDYRNMGVTVAWENSPVQLDANMGLVNAVQMMLMIERCGVVNLLPALPSRLSSGSAKKLRFTNGSIDIAWDRNKKHFKAKILLSRSCEAKIKLPSGFEGLTVTSKGGKFSVNGDFVTFEGDKGDMLTITNK